MFTILIIAAVIIVIGLAIIRSRQRITTMIVIPPGGKLDPVLEEQLVSLVANNRTIEAIKLVRTRTGMSLVQAKDYVENLKRQGGAPRPPQ